MKRHSLDLKEGAVALYEKGEHTQKEIAAFFRLSVSSLKRYLERKRELGHLQALPHGGGQKPLFDEKRLERLKREVARRPDATLQELCKRVPGPEGKPVSTSTMCRMLARLGLALKKEGALCH